MTAARTSGFNISFFDMAKARRRLSASRQYVVGYARLSFDEDGDNFVSIENQMSILEEFYHRQYENENSEYLFIADDNVSGYKFDREGLYKLTSLIEEGKCNIILAKDLSRIGRHGALTQLFIEQCERVGIRIHAMSDYDSTKESDDLILGIRAWSNERVVKDTSAKIKKIVKHKQNNGTWFCAAPFGYYVVDYQKGIVGIDEEAANTVRRIYNMYLDGIGITAIARTLTKEHVPTSNMLLQERKLAEGETFNKRISSNWQASFISALLSNEFYLGTLVTGRYKRDGINGKDIRTEKEAWHRFENHHEAIIEQEVFDAVQSIKESRAKYNFRTKDCKEHLFHGIVFCGECGAAEYAYAAKNLATQYVCSNYFKYGKNRCSRHRIRESLLISIAINFLKYARETCRDAIDALDSEMLAERETESDEKAVRRMEAQLTELETKMQVIEEQRVKQIIAHPEREESINSIYDRMIETEQQNCDNLHEKLRQMKESMASAADSIRKARRAIDIIDRVIETGTITRSAVVAIFDRIIVHDDGLVDVRLKPYLKSLDPQNYAVTIKPHKQPEENYTVTSGENAEKAASSINDHSDGDPLEIYTDRDGEVILKKYSPIGEMSSFAKDYTESLFRSLGHIACIVDRDQVVAASGVSKKELWDKPISPDLESAIQARQTMTLNRGGGGKMVPVTNEEDVSGYTAQVVSPIIADGEAIGAVLLLSREQGARMGDTEVKVAETAAGIVGRQMEQ